MIRFPRESASLAERRIVVTGASGFVGGHLVRQLVHEGAQVGALSRTRTEGLLDEWSRRCTFIACDLRQRERTRRVLREFAPEVLFHFASHPDAREAVGQAYRAIQVNLVGTLNALEAFRSCGGKLFLYGDSCKVYGDARVPYRETLALGPNSSYAITKAAAWHLCELYGRLHGLTVISLRPTLIYGPGQSGNIIDFVITNLLDGASEIRLDGGEQTRDPLFIDDAVEAFLMAARLGTALHGRVVNLGGGREISVRELAVVIAELMGARAAIVSCPDQARPTELWRSTCDNAEATALLGWTPKTPLRQGLERTIAYVTASRARRLRTGS